MVDSPFFSIIVPDFHGSVSALRRQRCIESLLCSTWADFEILLYHDGPAPLELETQYQRFQALDQRVKPRITASRFNDWGHSLRDAGLREAKGRYIVHLNADNILYPHALATAHAYSLRPKAEIPIGRAGPTAPMQTHVLNPEVLIFAVRMMGMMNVLGSPLLVRFPGDELKCSLILPGWPPSPGRIDAMQMVATREIWLSIGGWHDKSETSDGPLLSSIAQRFGYSVIPDVLGEHW